MRSKFQQFREYQNGGGSMSLDQWEADGRYDKSLELMSEGDLLNFKKWLSKITIPCPRCGYAYKVDENTINLVELSNMDHIALTGSPFHFKTHDIIACSNSKCDACFSYSETAYNDLYLKLAGDKKSLQTNL